MDHLVCGLSQTTFLIDRRWLQSNTARSNEFIMLELLGNWEPPNNFCTPRLREALESQNCLPIRNKNKKINEWRE